MAEGIWRTLSLWRDGGPAEGDSGYEKGYGEQQDHGPADLRGCGIWKDRDRSPGSLQGGAGEPAGGLSGSHDHSGAAALQYFCAAHEGISGADWSAVPFSNIRTAEKDAGGSAQRPGGYCDRHP